MLVRMVLLLMVLLLNSCATTSLSRNLVKSGTFELRGGVADKTRWETPLMFKRTSWYQELTLVYDLMITEIDNRSPFYKWFTPREIDSIKSCKRFYTLLVYSQDYLKIDHVHLRGELAKVGLVEVVITDFANQVRLHPDFEQFSLKHYKVKGFCAEREVESRDIYVSFPGFNSEHVY